MKQDRSVYAAGIRNLFAERVHEIPALERLKRDLHHCRFYYWRNDGEKVRPIDCGGLGIGKVMCADCEKRTAVA